MFHVKQPLTMKGKSKMKFFILMLESLVRRIEQEDLTVQEIMKRLKELLKDFENPDVIEVLKRLRLY